MAIGVNTGKISLSNLFPGQIAVPALSSSKREDGDALLPGERQN